MPKVIKVDADGYVVSSKIIGEGYVLRPNEHFVSGDNIDDVGCLFDGTNVTTQRRAVTPDMHVSVPAFIDRLGEDIYIEIELASMAAAGDTDTQSRQKARIRLFFEQVRRRNDVDLASAELGTKLAELSALIPQLTTTKIDEILTNPITEDERP